MKMVMTLVSQSPILFKQQLTYISNNQWIKLCLYEKK